MPSLSRPQSQQISSRNDFCGFEGWHHSPELAGAGLGGLKLEMLTIEIGERFSGSTRVKKQLSRFQPIENSVGRLSF